MRITTLTLNATVDRVLSVPGFAPGGVLRAELRALVPAGKGFNVSRVLAELGVGSVAAGLVGEGDAELYARAFRALGVRTRLCAFPGATRSNITVLDPDSGRETHLRERGPRVPPRAVATLESEVLRGPAGVLAFCGSLPPGVAPRRLARLLAAARASGFRLLVDSSGAALAGAWRLRPEILSVNSEELGELSGRRVSDVAAAASTARELLEASGEADPDRAGTILVKLGADGAVAVDAAGAWRARAPRIRAVNTVGAGDAFNAGYLAREGAGLSAALGFAVACGAAQAASAGLGRMSRSRVGGLARRVRVERIRG